MIKRLSFLAVLFLTSCLSLHTPTTHFVPSITNKNQFESELAIGSCLSANLAYSPIHHVSVMANAQILPKFNSSPFQRSAELALGYYGSQNKLTYGLNIGFGMGSYNWEYTQSNDTSSYSLLTIGNFQKLCLQPYIAFTDKKENPNWFAGVSFKATYYSDQFSALQYSYDSSLEFTGPKTNMSFEPCIFTRNFFSKSFYLNGQAGLNISYDESMFWPTQYVFVRVGVGFKLSKKSN